jgi:hypothetical protein
MLVSAEGFSGGREDSAAGVMRRRSGDLDIARLLAFGAGRYVETDALTFGQRLETVGLNRGKMGEEIFATAVGGNEAKTFGIVKPLDATCCHILNLRKMTGHGPWVGRDQEGEVKMGECAAGLRILDRQDNNTTRNRCGAPYALLPPLANEI